MARWPPRALTVLSAPGNAPEWHATARPSEGLGKRANSGAIVMLRATRLNPYALLHFLRERRARHDVGGALRKPVWVVAMTVLAGSAGSALASTTATDHAQSQTAALVQFVHVVRQASVADHGAVLTRIERAAALTSDPVVSTAVAARAAGPLVQRLAFKPISDSGFTRQAQSVTARWNRLVRSGTAALAVQRVETELPSLIQASEAQPALLSDAGTASAPSTEASLCLPIAEATATLVIGSAELIVFLGVYPCTFTPINVSGCISRIETVGGYWAKAATQAAVLGIEQYVNCVAFG